MLIAKQIKVSLQSAFFVLNLVIIENVSLSIIWSVYQLARWRIFRYVIKKSEVAFMKRIGFILSVCAILFCTFSVKAANGSIDDSRVLYTYWDREDWSVAYTGVVNKLSYQAYAPCVDDGYGYGCGSFALQDQYEEYVHNIFENHSHKHALQNRDFGYDYVVE